MSNFKGHHHKEETKAAISAALRGRKQSPEHIERKRLARIGKKHSDETRRKMSDAQKARTAIKQDLRAATERKHPRNLHQSIDAAISKVDAAIAHFKNKIM